MSSETTLKTVLCATTAAAAVASIALLQRKRSQKYAARDAIAHHAVPTSSRKTTRKNGMLHGPNDDVDMLVDDRYMLYAVDYAMHVLHRAKAVEKLLQEQPEAASNASAVLLHGGKEVDRYDTDTQYAFRQESFFQYLFGVREPDCAGMIDLATGQSVLFVPRLSDEWELWCGERKSLEYFKTHYMVDAVHYMDEMAKVLHAFKVKQLYVLHGKNTDSGLETVTTSTFDGIDAFQVDTTALHPVLVECRVIKSALELQLLRFLNELSSKAHIEVMKRIHPGLMEFHAESTFRHYCYSHGGARLYAYTCICGSGHNASALHYGHAGAPNDKKLEDGDMFLNDMGAELHGYASDITCSFPVNGHFTADQRMLYEGVLRCHDAVIAAIKPGVSYVDMHLLSHRVMTQYFLEQGLFQNGTVDELMDHEISVFLYPHGLGHLMGLDVHDVGGYPKGSKRSEKKILSKLRNVRVLEEGVVLTVEPGCYFIEGQLRELLGNPTTAKFVNIEMLERFRRSGGIRIESNIIVTATGAENMTKVPRTVREIERLMQKKQWP